MAANVIDAEIRKFLPLLDNEGKKSLLTKIKELLHIGEFSNESSKENPSPSSVDYSKYRFPVSAIKFDRDDINER